MVRKLSLWGFRAWRRATAGPGPLGPAPMKWARVKWTHAACARASEDQTGSWM